VGDNAGKIVQPDAYFAAGALWSNVEDLATWDNAWLSGHVVSQASMDLMQTPMAVKYFQSNDPSDYGMGWITHAPIEGHSFIWHNGESTSYTAFNGLLTDTSFSVTALTNFTVTESRPTLLGFGEELVEKICMTSAAGGC
jgi:CubicO group peptidase (beta-lactamase class C family)